MILSTLFRYLRGEDAPASPTTQEIDTLYRDKLCPLTQLYFFGSFNPVHEGHLYGARNALSALAAHGFNEVMFIPSAFPPNKKQAIDEGAYPLMSMAERTFRLERAIANMGSENSFKVLPLEQYGEYREEPCYTAQTLQRHFHTWVSSPYTQNTRLFMVMGEETFLSLAHWHQHTWLIQHCHFVVLPRPTHRTGLKPTSFEKVFHESRLAASKPQFTFLADVPTYDVNATQLRQSATHSNSIGKAQHSAIG
jgi:nicotinate (nicotinamide) nucleotide adenylyltransferase